MRKKLINVGQQERYKFYATFERYTFTSNNRGIHSYLLFNNVEMENDNFIDGDICFEDLKCFKKLNLEPGDRISFNARILDYIELYPYTFSLNPKKYYRLLYPTKVKKLVSPVKVLNYDQDNDFIIKVSTK